MHVHGQKGRLYEFVELGVGVILEILSSRDQVGDPPEKSVPFVCKASYVIDVLIGERVHRINLSVHWYHPDGSPQGWWSHLEEARRHTAKRGWYGVHWLN